MTKTILLGIIITTALIAGTLTMDFAFANHPQQAGYRLTQFVEDLASHIPVTSADIVDGTITSADLAPGVAGVPIGTVLDWWCSVDCTIPDGFVIADGSLVSDAASPFNGENLPDLTDKFVRGTTSVGNVGNTGGTLSHSHTHDHASQDTSKAGNHQHTVNPPPIIVSDSHNHVWTRYTGDDSRIWRAWNSDGATTFEMINWPNNAGLTSTSSGESSTSPGRPLPSADGDDSVNFYTEDTDVVLFVNIPPFNSEVGGGTTHTHSVDLPSKTSTTAGSEPPYFVLVKIIRIK